MSEIIGGWYVWQSFWEDGRTAAWNAQRRARGWLDYCFAPTREGLLAVIANKEAA